MSFAFAFANDKEWPKQNMAGRNSLVKTIVLGEEKYGR
jgi:hypothetical protein